MKQNLFKKSAKLIGIALITLTVFNGTPFVQTIATQALEEQILQYSIKIKEKNHQQKILLDRQQAAINPVNAIGGKKALTKTSAKTGQASADNVMQQQYIQQPLLDLVSPNQANGTNSKVPNVRVENVNEDVMKKQRELQLQTQRIFKILKDIMEGQAEANDLFKQELQLVKDKVNTELNENRDIIDNTAANYCTATELETTKKVVADVRTNTVNNQKVMNEKTDNMKKSICSNSINIQNLYDQVCKLHKNNLKEEVAGEERSKELIKTLVGLIEILLGIDIDVTDLEIEAHRTNYKIPTLEELELAKKAQLLQNTIETYQPFITEFFDWQPLQVNPTSLKHDIRKHLLHHYWLSGHTRQQAETFKVICSQEQQLIKNQLFQTQLQPTIAGVDNAQEVNPAYTRYLADANRKLEIYTILVNHQVIIPLPRRVLTAE